MNESAVMAGWVEATFEHDGLTRPVHRRGEGPGVIVVHEIPGITPAVARFANEVVERGFSVMMPELVGTAGRELSTGYLAASSLRMCVAREFVTFATGRTSPIIGWLRALARDLHLSLIHI